MQQQQNCEKTTPISSTTNEWSQNNNQITIIDDHKSFMASSAAPNKVLTMEKTNQAAADPHQQPLKCPRCDSANTKFCYYNNYSLSQPRHFCKACKRYWTRGGTLRNVPVGGGCRKNKRVKRSTSSQPSDGISSSGAAVGSGPATANPSSRSHIDLSPLSSHLNNPLFNYNLPTNNNIPMEMSFPFSRFRLSSSGFDIDQPPQMNGVGLGFSSGLMSGNHEYNNEFRQIQDHGISASRLLSNPTNLFGSSSSSTSFASTSSTTASLLASSLQQQKFGSSSVSGFPGLMPYDYQEMHQMGKEVKDEGENMRSDWNHENILGGGGHDEQINNPSHDSSSLLWNSMTNNGGGGGGGVWFDSSNIGSSVQSLI